MKITLPVTLRDQAKTTNSLRQDGMVPVVVYGPKQASLSLVVVEKTFKKVLDEAGESTIVELEGLDNKIEVLIKDVTFDPVKRQVTHIDLYALEQGKEITTTVTLEFIGEAKVEQLHLGSVTKVLHEVIVTCMPKDLPGHISVDISGLETIEDKIHISDLEIPVGVKVSAKAEDSVVVVTPVSDKTEDEEVVESVDMEAIEVEQKGKGEEGGEVEEEKK